MKTEELPPEAFIDGPPLDADLLLQRTLGTVRAERGRAVRRRGRAAAFTTAMLIAATLAGGVFLGQGLGEDTRLAEGGTVNGARMSVQMTSTEDGMRFVATVDGIADGEKCWFVFHTKDGRDIVAGSWLSHEQSVTLPGSAMVEADEVASVSVMGTGKRELLSAQVAKT